MLKYFLNAQHFIESTYPKPQMTQTTKYGSKSKAAFSNFKYTLIVSFNYFIDKFGFWLFLNFKLAWEFENVINSNTFSTSHLDVHRSNEFIKSL